MPNGSGLTPEEFETLERPLRQVDPAIDEFARQKGAAVVTNYHNSPGRRIVWCDACGVTKTILISPGYRHLAQKGNVQRSKVVVFAVVAHKDYPDTERPNPVDPTRPRMKRKWWLEKIAEVSEMPADEREFAQLLETGYDTVKEIRESDLKPA